MPRRRLLGLWNPTNFTRSPTFTNHLEFAASKPILFVLGNNIDFYVLGCVYGVYDDAGCRVVAVWFPRQPAFYKITHLH